MVSENKNFTYLSKFDSICQSNKSNSAILTRFIRKILDYSINISQKANPVFSLFMNISDRLNDMILLYMLCQCKITSVAYDLLGN